MYREDMGVLAEPHEFLGVKLDDLTMFESFLTSLSPFSVSYFYLKRKVLNDGVSTTPLDPDI